MANWKRRVDLTDIFDEFETLLGDKHEFVEKKAPIVAERLDKAIPKGDLLRDEELQIIIDRFREGVFYLEDFDFFMRDLHDWGDTNHRLFVDTMGINKGVTNDKANA